MSLNQQISNLVLEINIPTWADIKTIIEDCQDFCIEALLEKISEKFEDSISVAEKLNNLVDSDADLDAYEKLALELVWKEEFQRRESEITEDLKDYLSTEE